MLQPLGPDGATLALERLVGVIGEDAIFVVASGASELKDELDALGHRRADAYSAAMHGKPHSRMTSAFDPWVVDMARAMAPSAPPAWLPMMDVVREGVSLELGARGLRSLFSSKPSEKDVARVKRYGALAVRALRAVLASDGSLDSEEQTMLAALVAALGLPAADANALRAEAPLDAASIEGNAGRKTAGAAPPPASGALDHSLTRAILRGAWLGAAMDAIDPREEDAIQTLARTFGIANEELEEGRRDALQRVETRCRSGAAAVDGVRYVLSDRCPGLGVQLAARVGALMLPRRTREETLAPVGHGAPVALARRHTGLDAAQRQSVLGVAWAATVVDNPNTSRRALLRARWERFAQDLGDDDPSARVVVEKWVDETLVGVARTLR